MSSEMTDKLDLFSEEALSTAEALKAQYPNTWEVLYHKGLMPEILTFITSQKAIWEKEARYSEFDLVRGKFQIAIMEPKLRQDFREWMYKHEIELSTEDVKNE